MLVGGTDRPAADAGDAVAFVGSVDVLVASGRSVVRSAGDAEVADASPEPALPTRMATVTPHASRPTTHHASHRRPLTYHAFGRAKRGTRPRRRYRRRRAGRT